MLTVAASVDVQLRVTACPDAEIVVGEAVRVTAMGETETVAVAVVVPPGPTAVAVNVVVWLMAAVVTVPEAGGTEPMPLLMVREVAFAVDQVSVDLPPAATAVGCAES
jgi:hypothetical protein